VQDIGKGEVALGYRPEALKEGFVNLPQDLGRTFYSLAAAPYTLAKRGYEALCGYLAGRRAPALAEMACAAPQQSALEEAAWQDSPSPETS